MLRTAFQSTFRTTTRCNTRAILSHHHLSTSRSLATETPNEATRAELSMKRFWKDVGIEGRQDNLVVTLDKRGLKTPGGQLLAIPQSRRLVATLIATEWENQEKVLKPHALPMTSIVSRAIDGLSAEADRKLVCEALLKFLNTDTICFHEEKPPALVELQNKHWLPLLQWVRDEYGVEVKVFDSLFGSLQPADTRAKLASVLESLDQWELAAMERAVYSTKSFIISLALVKGRLTVEEAAQAAQVEVVSQIKKWGEVEDSHDVDYRDIRRTLGSAACLLVNA